MENLIEALKTTRLFLNTLGYTTNITFAFLVCQNFIHQKKCFNILNKNQKVMGQISYYDFNKKILISIADEENNITGKLDVAFQTAHKVNGYLAFDNKYHMALEMVVNSSYLVKDTLEPIVNFKGEYIKSDEHITFTIGDNSDFWMSKSTSQRKEMLKINAKNKNFNNPLLKHTLIVYGAAPIITSEKICQVSLAKLEGIKRETKTSVREQVTAISCSKDNILKSLGVFMKTLNPGYQESMITFNNQLNGLLARFLTIALPYYNKEEFKMLFGFEKELIELDNQEKVLVRSKN